MYQSKKSQSVLRMAELAVLTAIVLVLQFTGVAIRIPFLGTSVSLVLIPIALGAMLLGPAAGAWLGFVFGAITYIMGGVMGMDPFTTFLFQNNPVITAGICFVKSTLAGYLGGLVYRVLKDKKPLLAVFVAAMLVPVVNTGVFCAGCMLILDTIAGFISWAGLPAQGAVYFVFIGCAGVNFILEFAINAVFSPALKRVIDIVSNRFVK
jgi:uncharacterized membrane protein